MSSKTTCTACDGSGHDKGGKPKIKTTPYVEQYTDSRGVDRVRNRVRHETLQQGSGCLNCGGVGYK